LSVESVTVDLISNVDKHF